jgi:tetratricopeptide (TPR) repeat protein
MADQMIFLSYSRDDSDIALKLATELKSAGANVWMDQLDIPIGATWDIEIEKALLACNCILFIVSKTSVASDNVLNEVYYALQERKKVLPLKIDDCKAPFRIQRLQHIDLFNNYDRGFQQLLNVLSIGKKQAVISQTENKPKKAINLIKIFIGGGTGMILIIIAAVKFSKSDTITGLPNETSSNMAEDTSASIRKTADSINKVGDEYYNEGKYLDALTWYTKAAKAGNAYAMNNLGDMYYDGKGVKQDFNKAVEWYHPGAEAGNSDAMSNLGIMYENGYGVTRDYSKAIDWYRKAVEAGNIEAMNYLGSMYDDGKGVTQDFGEALKWYRKSAEGGNADAMNNLGIMYEFGKGVSKNLTRAKEWYREAKKAGYGGGSTL